MTHIIEEAYNLDRSTYCFTEDIHTTCAYVIIPIEKQSVGHGVRNRKIDAERVGAKQAIRKITVLTVRKDDQNRRLC